MGIVRTRAGDRTTIAAHCARDSATLTRLRSSRKRSPRAASEADEAANITAVERYTYVFDHQNEQLDHLFLSSAIASRGVQVEHVHVNQFAETIALRASDHDPSIAKLNVC